MAPGIVSLIPQAGQEKEIGSFAIRIGTESIKISSGRQSFRNLNYFPLRSSRRLTEKCDEHPLDDQFGGRNEIRKVRVLGAEKWTAFLDDVSLESGFTVD